MSRLGDILRKWRVNTEQDLRSVASSIGISVSTLSRVERGEMPDGETLSKILCWLMATGVTE